jgi:hypothetical protein
MDAKEAIKAAKAYVQDIFKGEGVINIGLEEISFDEHAKAWDVTIGFTRRWDTQSSVLAAAAGLSQPSHRRTYKIIEVSNENGEVLAVRNRPTEFAA